MPHRLLLLLLPILLALGCGGGSGTLFPDDDDTATDDDDATGDDDDSTEAVDCSALNPLPVQFETVANVVSAEDFVFDAKGGVIGVDPQGNVLRSVRDGDPTLIAPGAVSEETAGVSMLPGGDIVVADVAAGSLVRISAAGGATTILSGLSYPNGIEVHRDGWVAVAEQDSGQVRRVDPDTGEFVILATDLFAPNGVTFSPDYTQLYVGSFGGGTVEAIPLDADGASGPPVLLGSVGEGGSGEPPPWGWDPWSDSCDGLSDGDPCTLLDQQGTCYGGFGGLWCDAPDPFELACDGLSEGDPCQVMTERGSCADFDFGALYCYDPAWFPGGDGGGLDGIAVDGCGNVYTTEFGPGKVWRWTEDGAGPDLVAELPNGWIPNMDFGPGAGGWDTTKLWVVTRDSDEIYGLDIGVVGRPLPYR